MHRRCRCHITLGLAIGMSTMMMSSLWSHGHIVVVTLPWHGHASSLSSYCLGIGHLWHVVVGIVSPWHWPCVAHHRCCAGVACPLCWWSTMTMTSLWHWPCTLCHCCHCWSMSWHWLSIVLVVNDDDIFAVALAMRIASLLSLLVKVVVRCAGGQRRWQLWLLSMLSMGISLSSSCWHGRATVFIVFVVLAWTCCHCPRWSWCIIDIR